MTHSEATTTAGSSGGTARNHFLTGQQLDECEALARAAAAGPWSRWREGQPVEVVDTEGQSLGRIWHKEEAAFVIAARAAMLELIAEIRQHRELESDATEYRVHLPENGGTTLHIKRQSGVTGGVGWAVSVPGYGGGRAWTMEGWQESISALSVDRLFCWPSAEVARDEARRALAAKEA